MDIGPMLPVTLQFLIALIAYAINERMARRVDYLREEVHPPSEATTDDLLVGCRSDRDVGIAGISAS
jgi:hypothetical protein